MRKFHLYAIYAIIIALIASSCSPLKQISRLQKKGYLLPKTDTLYIPGEPRDTTIYDTIPGETVSNDVLIFVEDDKPKMKSVKAETEHAKAEAHIEGNKIILTLTQKPGFFEHHLTDAIRKDKIHIHSVVEVPVQVKPKTFAFYKSGFFISIGLLVFFIFITILLKKR